MKMFFFPLNSHLHGNDSDFRKCTWNNMKMLFFLNLHLRGNDCDFRKCAWNNMKMFFLLNSHLRGNDSEGEEKADKRQINRQPGSVGKL